MARNTMFNPDGGLPMAELKTKPTGSSVSAFLNGIKDEQRRQDCMAVARIMKRVTKANPRMWGPSIVGFGQSHAQRL
jgi:hypothetical protein